MTRHLASWAPMAAVTLVAGLATLAVAPVAHADRDCGRTTVADAAGHGGYNIVAIRATGPVSCRVARRAMRSFIRRVVAYGKRSACSGTGCVNASRRPWSCGMYTTGEQVRTGHVAECAGRRSRFVAINLQTSRD